MKLLLIDFTNALAIDWRDKLQLNEQYIYGSARVGMLNRSAYVSKCFTTGDHMSAQDGYQAFGSTSYVVSTLVYSHEMSSNDILPYEKSVIFVTRKTYEFSDHLGNVSATISDRKITIAIGAGNAVASYTPEVLSEQDYFPFGMGMMGRSVTAEGYRYGYQKQEIDDELWSGAVSYKNRIEDPRTGKFLSVDNRYDKYPSNTPYGFVCLNPIMNVEADGDTIRVYYQYSGSDGQSKVVNFLQINTSSENIYITITQDQIPTSVVAGVNLVADGTTGPIVADMSSDSNPTDGSVDATIMSFGFMFGAVLAGSFSIDYVSMINGKDAGKNFLTFTYGSYVGGGGGAGMTEYFVSATESCEAIFNYDDHILGYATVWGVGFGPFGGGGMTGYSEDQSFECAYLGVDGACNDSQASFNATTVSQSLSGKSYSDAFDGEFKKLSVSAYQGSSRTKHLWRFNE